MGWVYVKELDLRRRKLLETDKYFATNEKIFEKVSFFRNVYIYLYRVRA